MRGSLQGQALQAESVLEHYKRLLAEGNTTYAKEVRKANPDLVKQFDQLQDDWLLAELGK